MDLKLESHDGFLLASASGRVSVTEAQEWCKNICGVAAERGFSRIVVDCVGVEGELSDLERYEIGKSMAENCLNRSMYPKIALVGKPPMITGFEALVARNRGLTVFTFSERQAGLEWLNGFGLPLRREPD
jgi:hypothetical protein